MAAIRFVRNINLKVEYDGAEEMVPFGAGDIFNATKIEVDGEGFNNIHMPDGSVIRGVSGEVFENMGGKVPVSQVESVEVAPENEEFEVEAPEVQPAVLDGTMLGKDDTPDEYIDPEQPPTEVE